jgi:hypothetical protein
MSLMELSFQALLQERLGACLVHRLL